ncbi:hypothetical protein CUR178_07746 [Leishmania enriettii]|uniref:Uncharacterized protein n=1 Tax=Leishmania enriettii TaxID=5663 RepID=A0A836KUM5_LEIEN|nr:hypothetical protein CUR178_07746 [Leishmania enriettii]
MFQGCLQLCLEFIGAQAPANGCSSAQLSDFICEDLIPYQGWAANDTLRDTIARLLLATRSNEFHVYAATEDDAVTSGAPKMDTASRATGSCGGRGRKKAAPASSPAPAASNANQQRRRVSAEEAISLLDSGLVAWKERGKGMGCGQYGRSEEHQPQPSSASGRDGGCSTLLFFTPSHSLRERVMGFSIKNEKLEMLSSFLAENALLGWDRLPSTPEFKARYKNHLVGNGLKWLRRVHKVTLVYMYHEPSREVVYRFFPHFALPLTEREKAEPPICAAEEGSGSRAEVSSLSDGHAPTPSDEGEQPYRELYRSGGDSGDGVGLSATASAASAPSLQQLRNCRRNYPLDHYYARKRRDETAFPGVAFDLQVVRQLVQQSPERRLLMQDAVHAILSAHGLFLTHWEDFSRTERMHLRRLMSAAGLSIVVASVTLRSRVRELRLVIPTEDLVPQVAAASPPAFSVAPGSSRTRAGENGGGDGETKSCTSHPYGSDRDAGAEDGRGDDTNSRDVAALRSQLATAPVILRADREPDRGGAAEGVELDDHEGYGARDSASDEDNCGEGDDAPSRAEALLSRPSTRHQQSEAVAVLRVEANHALELQAAQEAERRPLSLTAAVPRVRFHMPYTQRGKVLGAFLERYAKMRGTLMTQYLMLRRSKVFTLVYAPRASSGPAVPGPYLTEATAATVVKGEEHGDSYHAGEDVAVATAVRTAVGAAAEAPLPLPRTLHFEPNDPRLPKGLSAYSVNTVLDVLVQAAPHHAASVPRLIQSIDVSTLNRRVLPFLRRLEYVHTTAVAQRGRRHVGLVVLAPAEGETRPTTLSDAAKRAVLDAEASAAAELTMKGAGQAAPPSVASGKSILSGIVLQSLPAVADGARRSTLGERLAEVQPAAAKAVNRVMAVRNGYARSLVQRMSRLHLELWYQHYRYPAKGAVSAPTAGAEGVRVREMYARMTLSTFVVVVGLPQADLGRVLGSADCICDWSTPLRDLPPSLYGWCMQRGTQMLFACLQGLQDRHLIRSAQGGFHSCLSPEGCDDVTYTLESQCIVNGCTHYFMSVPPTAAASLYACMRYWLPYWSAIERPPCRLASQFLTLESNAAVAQVVALSKMLRQDPSILAAQLYQSGGLLLESRRSTSLGDVTAGAVRRGAELRGVSGPRSISSSASLLARRHLGRADDEESTSPPTGSGAAAGHHVAPQRTRKAPRTELSGPTVAEALESAFQHFTPVKRVEEVVRLVLRGRSVHLSHHPLFSVPAALPAVSTRRHRGAEASIMPPSPTGGGECDRAAIPTEFNVTNAGQCGGAYNRLVSTSTTHMAVLAETLRAVRNSNALHRGCQLRRASSTEALRDEVEGVYSPRAAASAAAAAAGGASAAWSTASAPLSLPAALLPLSPQTSETRLSPPSTPLSLSLQLGVGFEVVADILRMIVFSDQAHYRAGVARSLLAALSTPWLVARARAFLQQLPVFRPARQQNIRVPQLSLAHSPYVLPLSALRSAPRPCANMAVLHQWALEADAVGGAVTGGRESSMMMWANAEMNELLASSARAPLQRTLPSSLQLLHQPSMDQACMSIAPNAVREKMTRLPLPQLAWPAEAVACEGLLRRQRPGGGEGAHTDEAGVVVDTVAGRCSPQHRKRKRGPQERGRGDASSGEEYNDDTSESSKDGVNSVLVARAEAETTRQLYPARTIRNYGDPSYLQDLPVDGPPTVAEQRAVEACREALSSGAFASFSPISLRDDDSRSRDGGGGLMPYPSIFHHVDGSWHSYMWHLVVHTVYRYILRVPGIRHADLEGRLLASGVVSQRALWAVLQFLIDHQLLLCHAEELAQPLCAPGGGVLGDPPRLHSPFQLRKCSRPDTASAIPSSCSAPVGKRDFPHPKRDSDVRLSGTLGNCCYHPTIPLEGLRLAMSPHLLSPSP